MRSIKTRHRAKSDATAPWFAGALLVAMALVAYALVARAGFIWDDEDYIVNNATLRSLDGLRNIWFDLGAVRQYYPLTHTTFWIEYHLWHLAPLGYHVTNVLLHATGAVLLWRLLARLEVPGAWLAAAIFAVHPVEVESVAWVTERKNVLSFSRLALASMLCYLRFSPVDDSPSATTVGARRWRWYALALALFVGALLAKTVVATMPAVLLVIVWWKRGDISWRDVARLVPFLALGIGFGLLTAWMEKHGVGATGDEWNLTPVDRVLIAGRALWFYAAKLACPYPLVFFYPRWNVDSHAAWQYVFPAAALTVIIALWFARARIGRGPLAAVLIFAGVLAPALGFFDVYPFRFSFVADHFQYHASAALIALAGAGGALATARLQFQDRGSARLVAVLVFVILAAFTMRQTLIYQNLETLYRHTIAHNPTSWLPYTNLACYLDTLGRRREAVELIRQAAPLGPRELGVHYNMGVVLFEQGKYDGFAPGQLDEAISHYNTALELSPQFVPAHINLAEALIVAHRPEQAMDHLRVALELDPSSADAHLAMGNLAIERNELPLAARSYADAVLLRPEYVEAIDRLGDTLLKLGQVDQAIRCFNEALRQKPDDSQAKASLDQALEAKRRGSREKCNASKSLFDFRGMRTGLAAGP